MRQTLEYTRAIPATEETCADFRAVTDAFEVPSGTDGDP